MPKDSSFSSKFKSIFSPRSKSGSTSANIQSPEPSGFKPSPEQLLLLTGNHDADFHAAYSLYSTFSARSKQCEQKFNSVQLNSAEETNAVTSYTAAVVLEMEAGLLLSAIAPKAYGLPDPNRVLNSEELRRAQTLVDALCRKFVSYYQMTVYAQSIKDIPSKKDEWQQLQDSIEKVFNDANTLADKITKIYWPVPPAVPIGVDDSDKELEELREKVKQLEKENKTFSSLYRACSDNYHRIREKNISLRRAIEEKDATITVLKRRLKIPTSAESQPSPDGDQVEFLKQQLLNRDVQLEELQKRFDKLDGDYAEDLDKVTFVDDYLVFLEKDKMVYHCYTCSQFKVPFDYKDAFVCCDRKTARSLGYTACTFCRNSDSEFYTED